MQMEDGRRTIMIGNICLGRCSRYRVFQVNKIAVVQSMLLLAKLFSRVFLDKAFRN